MFRKRVLVAVAVLAVSASAQVLLAPTPSNLDVLIRDPTAMDFHTFDEIGLQRQRQQVQTRSEATVSVLDLKAPGKARADYEKGLQFLMQKKYQEAIAPLAKAIAVYPSYVAAHSALGYAYFQLKENDQARSEFARAIELDDHLSGSYLNLGRVEMAMGDMPSAQKSFQKAVGLAPLDDSLVTSLAYVQLMNKDYAAVVQTAERAHARKHPNSAVVHYFSAAAWQGQKNYENTQSELQTFLAEAPQSDLAPQARQLMAHIQAVKDAPPTEEIHVAFDTSAATSMRGQKVLQDLREKQQIAEAEAEGTPGDTRNVEPAAGSVPSSPALASSPAVSIPNGSGWVLRSRVDEVALFFTATDHGKSVTDLKQSEVVLRDDGHPPQSIRSFRSEAGLPLRLGLLIDMSESVKERFAFEQKAARKFLQEVVSGKDDQAFVAGFSNTVVMVQDFTGDQSQLAIGMNKLAPVGGTAIWDAVSFAADKLAEEKQAQPMARILVVFSDGDDNSSSATLKEAIQHAERDDVIIYTISTREPDPADELVLPGNRAMEALAGLTGGTAFFPVSQSHFSRSLADLQEVIRGRYLIAYKPADFQYDGRYRPISVSAVRSGHKLKVYSRKGYYTRDDHRATMSPPNPSPN